MYGGVGCGKSMLMDLFFACCDGVVQRKRRVHFHAFMLEVHRKMHELKQSGHQVESRWQCGWLHVILWHSFIRSCVADGLMEWPTSQPTSEPTHQRLDDPTNQRTNTHSTDQGDPLPLLVDDYMRETTLLCFDEFQVTDVADALIMRRLFGGLIDRGMVMVSTSNRDPDRYACRRALFV